MRVVRAFVRFIAAVTMVTGCMLIVETVITIAWQEPISAAIASRSQAALEDDLEVLDVRAATQQAALERTPSKEETLAALAFRQEEEAETGDAIGKIELPTQDRSYAIVEGTGTGPLRKGPGHYEETPFPGRQGTFAVAGHRTTYLAPFRDVDDLERDDPIAVTMPYATLTYRVDKSRIVEPEDVGVKRSVGRERLVLTACHPLYSAAQRIVVFAELDRVELRHGDARGGQGA